MTPAPLPATELDRYCIWIVSPPDYPYSRVFDEVALGLSEAMAILGGSAPIVRDAGELAGRTPIVLGGNLLPQVGTHGLPADTVIHNLEQVGDGNPWFSAEYLASLRAFRVVDYSPRNRAGLERLGVAHAGLLEIGYTPGLSRIRPAPEKDIDVLFYGSLNERRVGVLQRLAERGLRVGHITQGFGAERDEGIARSKVVLNLHFYDSAVFEIVRVSYLLANGVCVVTEGRPDDPDIAPYTGGMAVAAYDELVTVCEMLARDEPMRDRIAARGLELFRARPQEVFLRRALGGLRLPQPAAHAA
ncbi:MAG: hypothetical protein IT200_09565 [Thermoleophilia bacterium]|nr:hypothetical protein [Thermoleophilia bacterium]